MNITAHIISHTHWDREWYINSKFTNEWLPPFFDALFKMMEREPDYKFVLDGQMSIVDDYFAELEKTGGSLETAKQNIRKFGGEGRLILGPYYLQPDWQLVSDEALVRNMLIGRKLAREYGREMKVGWLLDNFGQIAQAPQIHKQFGMEGMVVWRGVELNPHNLKSEFLWQSPDGTTMRCGYLLSSYRNAMRLAEHSNIIYARIKNEVEKILPFATTPNVLLMNGYDQEMIPDDILPYIRDGKADFNGIHVVQSTPEEYMAGLIKSAPKDNDTLKGALCSGRYISVFPGIFSSRIYLKQQNEYCQKLLERYAEPVLSALAACGAEYPAAALEDAWKLLLKSQPHDSICGVSIDDVHTDMEKRYAEVARLALEQLNRGLDELCANINTEAKAEKAMVVFTPSASGLPATVELPVTVPHGYAITDGSAPLEFINCGDTATVVMKNSPSVGYKTLYLQKAEAAAIADSLKIDKHNNKVENKYIAVSVAANGSLEVLHKQTGQSYKNIGMLEEMADSGDEYNYSYPDNDRIINTLSSAAKIQWVRADALKAVIKISHKLMLPQSIKENRRDRADETLAMPVVTTVTIERDTPYVRFHTELKNTVRDHRVRVLFPTELCCEESFAQTQFDVTNHPVTPVSFDNSTIPENVSRIIIGARESAPVSCFSLRRFCGMSDGAAGAAAISDGLPEYEVIDNGKTLALTLFRSVGWIARTDINTRIGDAGPEIITPDAQCLRTLSFDYGFYPFAEGWQQADLLGWSDMFCVKPIVKEISAHSGSLSDCASLVQLDCEDNAIQLTAVKRSEDNSCTLVRLYNASEKAATAKIRFGVPVVRLRYSDLAEQPGDEIAVKDNGCSIEVPAKKIITLLVTTAFAGKLTAGSKGAEVTLGSTFEEDFSSFMAVQAVTMQEVNLERARAQKLEDELAALEQSACDLEEFGTESIERQAALSLAYQKREAVRRAALEARLSAILAEKKYLELGGDTDTDAKFEERLREISLTLNQIRLTKRTAEYISDYYKQLVKEQGNMLS